VQGWTGDVGQSTKPHGKGGTVAENPKVLRKDDLAKREQEIAWARRHKRTVPAETGNGLVVEGGLMRRRHPGLAGSEKSRSRKRTVIESRLRSYLIEPRFWPVTSVLSRECHIFGFTVSLLIAERFRTEISVQIALAVLPMFHPGASPLLSTGRTCLDRR
jgi:hypothetical protein